MKLRMRPPLPPSDPEVLLDRHQQELAALYQEFSASTDDAGRRRAVERICHVVAAQCEVEDEILYPEANRRARRPDNRLRAAQMEGAFMRKVVDQIRSLRHDDPRLAGTLDVLKGYLTDYLEQQRADVMPRLRRRGPTADLCEAMLQRRAQLLRASAPPAA